MAKGRVEIDDDRCKGCALCTTACPQHVLFMADDQLNARGYHPALLADPDGHCTGCALCAVICPDACIKVYRYVTRRSIAASL
ncbi:MAG: ferredoxin family protein [Chloroflexi bacterium]|nr:ferredoxin family protein [Chloroflexota bacterium]